MIPRHHMPQIDSKDLGAFIKFTDKNGVRSEDIGISPDKLRPVQGEFNKEKVLDMKKKFETSGTMAPILIANDGYILDGNHRWIAQALADRQHNVSCIWFKCPITDLVRLGHEFEKSFVKTVDEMTTYKKLAYSLI